MRKTTVVMSPTLRRAGFEFEAFWSRWPKVIKKANKACLYIELLSGHIIYFKAETEGPNALRGPHADIISADEFVMLQKSEVQKMTKTVCDICGKEMPLEIHSRSTEDYKFCISSYGKIWDVCVKCRDELNEWMKKRKTESEE